MEAAKNRQTAERIRIRETALSAVQSQDFAKDYADACEAFYLFRWFHSNADQHPAWAVLTGDYFFSRFSHALIPIDSVELIDRFSDYLKEDVKKMDPDPDIDRYLAFIRQTALEISL